MSYQYVFVMKNLNKTHLNGKEVLKDITLSFLPGAKIGVVGSNGAGKSTLLRIMAGVDKEFSGEAWAAERIKVGYLEQEPQLDSSKNVFENILEGLKSKKDLLDRFNEITKRFSEPLSDDEMAKLIEEQGELQEKIDAVGAWELEREVEIAMDALGCPSKENEIAKLSGGEKRRVALCKLILERPDMLLLDEPTNHLDAESVAWLENHLKNYLGTVVVVTHDRYFLNDITDWILELDRGKALPWQGNYFSWLEERDRRYVKEQKSEDVRRLELQQELEWVRQSPKGRRSKNKARLNAYEEAQNEASEKRQGVAQIIIPKGNRLGNTVVEGEHISKKFGSKILINDFTFRVDPGAIIGVIGKNGAGKTTLFKMITGKETPDSGNFKVGESVNLGYVDQSRDTLDSEKNIWEEISEGNEEIILGDKIVKSRAYCAAFNFKGSDQQKKVGSLSGGERNRVHLAKMLKKGANVILLDEPTNDLDIETLRALENALENFPGCAIIISHDRWFLDRICTHIISFEGEGRVEFYDGNYSEYEEYKAKYLSDLNESSKNQRFKKATIN
jgi:sulfate-transporting ATPase